LLPRIFCLVGPADDLSLLGDLADAGVDGFQVRAKELGGRDLMVLTEQVLGVVRPRGAVVVVNDRLDAALAAGADGVHLGADDLGVAEARKIAPELLIGATCRSAGDVAVAARAGADYAGFGPVFATTSKPGLPPPLGLAAVAAAAGTLPLLAIGGIAADSASAARAAGAHGVAVIGGIWNDPDPVAAARAIVEAVR
jgi:thiamine-phosphate pyrophosphorylase